MNKKVNTLIFILAGTVFNVLIAIGSFILLSLLYMRFLMMIIPEQSRSWGFTFIFLASLAISFLVYRLALKFLLTKFKAEDYFDPLFIKRNLNK